MELRDRIKELRRVPANSLRPHPGNWRTHPARQADALRGVLAEVGIANAVLARECSDGGLMLIDGHLRAETLGTETIPVLVLDVSEEEAAKLLLTLDPLAAMAESDQDAIRELLEQVETENVAVREMIDGLIAEEEGVKATDNDAERKEIEKLDKALQLEPGREYVVIVCESEEDWEEMRRDLKLGLVRRGGYRKGSAFESVGTQRVKTWADFKAGR